MYGLPQFRLLANQLLEKRFKNQSYQKSKLVPGLWRDDWRLVQFALLVDTFGVKCVGEEHASHLKRTIEYNYIVTTEWNGKQYIGITLD